MKIYFLSDRPCALSLNGVYFGRTDAFERFADVTLSDGVYAQFSPENALPIGFFLTENLRSSPPEGCEVYLLKDALAVYAYGFPPRDFALRVLAQKREGELLATLFCQGALQLSVESPAGFFNATLPPSFARGRLAVHGKWIVARTEERLAVFDETAAKLLDERALEYEIEGARVTAVLPLSDSRNRTAKCTWDLSEGGRLLEFSLQERAEADSPPSEGLLAYAFFETVLLGGDFARFLSEELRRDAERIRAFLGNFIAVTLTKEENVCGLVRKKGERLYAVDEISVDIAEGRIIDVRG